MIEHRSDRPIVFHFARVGAAIGMKVEDYFIQGRRGWVRLHEKAASATTRRRITNLTNIWKRTSRASISKRIPRGPLFRTAGREIRCLSRFALLSNSNYEPKSSLNPGLRGGVYQKSLWFCLTSLFSIKFIW
jgi:integrase